jgi:hypothetical protein
MINNLFGPASSGGGDVLGGFGNLSIGGGGSGGFASSLAGWASTPTEHPKDTSSDQRGIGLGGVVLGPDPSSSNFGQQPQQNSRVSEQDQHQTQY